MPVDLSQLNIQVSVVLPSLVLVGFAMLVMLLDMFGGKSAGGRAAMPWLSLVGVIAAAVASAWLWNQPVATFQNMAISDQFALAHDQLAVGHPSTAPGKINQAFIAGLFNDLAHPCKIQIIQAGGVVMNALLK